MKLIEESDFYVEYKNYVYYLYLLKNKKEKKEKIEPDNDDTDTHKIGGYFTNIDSVFKEIIKFRQHKKYSFNEKWEEINKLFIIYKDNKIKFLNLLKQIYIPIKELKSQLLVYEKKEINYWK